MSALINLGQVKEILQLMQLAPAEDPGQIWQTQELLRQVYNITKLQHDETMKALVIESLLDFDFSLNFPVFVRINHRDLIFKIDPKKCVIRGNRIICHYPELAKAIENRSHARISAPANQAISVILRSAGGNGEEVKALLNDFSQSGLGIFFGNEKSRFFQGHSKFQLVSIGELLPAKPILMQLKYFKTLSENGSQVGFRLDTPFSGEMLQVITSIVLGTKV